MVAFGGPFHPRGVSSTSWKFDFFVKMYLQQIFTIIQIYI